MILIVYDLISCIVHLMVSIMPPVQTGMKVDLEESPTCILSTDLPYLRNRKVFPTVEQSSSLFIIF